MRRELDGVELGQRAAEGLRNDAAMAVSDALHKAWYHEGDWRDDVCSCGDDGVLAVDAAWPIFYKRLYIEITGEVEAAP